MTEPPINYYTYSMRIGMGVYGPIFLRRGKRANRWSAWRRAFYDGRSACRRLLLFGDDMPQLPRVPAFVAGFRHQWEISRGTRP